MKQIVKKARWEALFEKAAGRGTYQSKSKVIRQWILTKRLLSVGSCSAISGELIKSAAYIDIHSFFSQIFIKCL